MRLKQIIISVFIVFSSFLVFRFITPDLLYTTLSYKTVLVLYDYCSPTCSSAKAKNKFFFKKFAVAGLSYSSIERIAKFCV